MRKVLIADDEPIIREGLKHIIDWEEQGFEIVGESATGSATCKSIMSLSPDLVMMDIRMPGMTGLDVLNKVRSDGYEGEVIILSGFSDFSYAREAISLGVSSYLTKPVDEDELLSALKVISEKLDSKERSESDQNLFYEKIRTNIITDLLLGQADTDSFDPHKYGLNAHVFMVAIYEKFNIKSKEKGYSFSELLSMSGLDPETFDHVNIAHEDVILLKGEIAVRRFNDFLQRYEQDNKPQKDSPLDSLFIAYGQTVSSPETIAYSYQEASGYMRRRFFCDQGQHTFGPMQNSPDNLESVINDDFMHSNADKLVGYIQSFNRNQIAETLTRLKDKLYYSSDDIEEIRLFLADMFLSVKEELNRIYPKSNLPFPGNSDIIRFIKDQFYLYEVLLFFTEQFEAVMSSIGGFSRESVMDDILNYIEHNYASNITLENIAPLFGYNSSYLGKIFSKRVGENFNSYLDKVRIRKAKEFLLNEDIKVYAVAERVGYKNVDYFHVKFKKQMGMTPAEFRKKNQKGQE